jgi:uncharacterized damage-inducible protein DinB
MKNYFLKLFAYDKFENEAIIASMISANVPEPTERLMAHVLSAQQIWLGRCKGIPPASPVVLWPDWKADTFHQTVQDNYWQWADHLSGLEDDDFERVIAYKNSFGVPYENKLVDILTHVTNHGTHHRAQIGLHLKQAGLEKLPETDYIVFLRSELLR